MKNQIFESVKLVLSIVLTFCVTTSFAQDYLISFAGTGATTEVGTVKVNNLTSGATLTLNGGDILHLSATVGISNLATDNGTIQVYPNPMAEQSILTFGVPENGNAIISIVDLSGRIVCQISTFVLTGTCSFRISGISLGMYFVKVTSKNYFYSTKLLSKSKLPGDARIEYVSSVKNTTGNHLKSNTATIDMLYNDGDLLLFKGISGQYSTIVTDIPTGNKTITFTFVPCTDNNGKNYATVQIGSQTWMAENLNVGTRINGNQQQTDNGIIQKYCYNDLVSNCNIYGGLYQWNEMMQYVTWEGTQGICPTGWYIPTDYDWNTLTDYLGGESIAGGKLKETSTIHWASPNNEATNISGFTALPGGSLIFISFEDLTYHAYFWSSSEYNNPYAYYRYLKNDDGIVNRYFNSEDNGYSVRCVKN